MALLTGCASGGGGTPVEQAEDRRLAASPELIEALAANGTGAEAAGSNSTSGEGEQGGSRVRAALAMGRIQDASYAGPLSAASGAPEPDDVRAAALFALGQLGLASGARPTADAVEASQRASRDSDPVIAALGVEALGKLADAATTPTLIEALGHESPEVRTEAAMALFRLRFVPVWRGEAESPPQLSDDAVAALTAALADEASTVRVAAAHAFARYAEPRAQEPLMAMLRELGPSPANGAGDAVGGTDDEWMRLFAIRALGRIADVASGPAIVPFVTDPNPRVRTAAVTALGAVGAIANLPPVVMFDDSFHVRAAAARAWAQSEADPTLEFLGRLAKDPSPMVAGAAIETLAERIGDAYIVGIDFFMKSEDPVVRAAVARATASLPTRGYEYAIQALDDDPDIRVRTAALSAMGSWPEGHESIVAALTADDLALRGTAVGLIGDADIEDADKQTALEQAYAGSADDAWVEVRESIIDALGELEEARAFLQSVVRDDPASSVRSRARLALRDAGVDLPPAEAPAIEPSRWLGKSLDADPVVVLETSKGPIEIRCFAKDAPTHVASLVHLVQEGFYDGLSWHRVVSGFVIQGGDPRGDGWGSGGVVLRDEINRRRFTRGSVGMPKAGKDTGGCQIFITHVPTPHLDGNYTVFGQVETGMDVVDQIEVGDTIVRAYIK